jgi:hypothetical protein
MKNSITQQEVSDFKTLSCNENEIIANLIKEKILPYFIEPILDVGAGAGDISYHALHDKKVICIDTNEINGQLSKSHQRKQIDFFEYNPTEQINTIFICHALQFLDDDVDRLNSKVQTIDPRHVITVTNDNDDFLGEIVQWTKENYPQGNPEIQIDFPRNYKLAQRFPFRTDLVCKNFAELAKQVSYLMLIDQAETTKKLQHFLENRLPSPEFTFNQSICVHKK